MLKCKNFDVILPCCITIFNNNMWNNMSLNLCGIYYDKRKNFSFGFYLPNIMTYE